MLPTDGEGDPAGCFSGLTYVVSCLAAVWVFSANGQPPGRTSDKREEAREEDEKVDAHEDKTKNAKASTSGFKAWQLLTSTASKKRKRKNPRKETRRTKRKKRKIEGKCGHQESREDTPSSLANLITINTDHITKSNKTSGCKKVE
jgi:Flp pilus assembly protein TadB